MRLKLIALFAAATLSSAANAFEFDGIEGGISMSFAEVILSNKNYDNVLSDDGVLMAEGVIPKGFIQASDDVSKGFGRYMPLGFCNDKLTHLFKALKPSLEAFARLTDDKRKELGAPTDSWSNPVDISTDNPLASIGMQWKDDKGEFTTTKYSGKHLSIKYNIPNDCGSQASVAPEY